jgi:hypothetical protein
MDNEIVRLRDSLKLYWEKKLSQSNFLENLTTMRTISSFHLSTCECGKLHPIFVFHSKSCPHPPHRYVQESMHGTISRRLVFSSFCWIKVMSCLSCLPLWCLTLVRTWPISTELQLLHSQFQSFHDLVLAPITIIIIIQGLPTTTTRPS